MGTYFLTLALIVVAADGPSRTEALDAEEQQYQTETFAHWWGADMVWRFADLPATGSVPRHRVPYSGYIYPDAAGGVEGPIRKYDRAFHDGRLLATAHEIEDTTSRKESVLVRGPLRLRRRYEQQTPAWHGHCNGWAAAAIRHAAPRQEVVRNGVVFTPADIKGLLAEIYMYNGNESLGGADAGPINPGLLHTVLANWLGRGSHPVAMDREVGDEVWNYPIYAYAASHAYRSPHEVQVRMHVAYADHVPEESNEPQHVQRILHFHYVLALNEQGEITGGRYLPDSARINMLWTPLRPVPSGSEGNELGNPHIDVHEVLAMWRESVPEALRREWLNIDPTEEDLVGSSPAETSESAAERTIHESASSTSPTGPR